VDEDASGLTFEKWDPSADTDTSQDPVVMIVRTRGAVLKQIHDLGTRRYVLSVDNDTEYRSRCE